MTDDAAPSPTEYAKTLADAHALRLAAVELDTAGALDAAIDACNVADSMGAVLDPTLYRAKHEAMAQDRETLRAVRALARLGQELPT